MFQSIKIIFLSGCICNSNSICGLLTASIESSCLSVCLGVCVAVCLSSCESLCVFVCVRDNAKNYISINLNLNIL